MSMEIVKFSNVELDLETGEEMEISVKGPSKVPFWNDDLKANAAISLISTIDLKNFDNPEDFFEVVESLKKAVSDLEKYAF